MNAECTLSPPEFRAKAFAERLNDACQCITVDGQRLEAAITHEAGPGFIEAHVRARPHLISNVSVFLARRDVAAMLDIVAAAESVAALPQYREAALARAPESAKAFFGQAGAFMGYDFHIAEDRPKLIEINTNAGGAFVSALVARAQTACCAAVAGAVTDHSVSFESAVVAQFESEWRAQFGDAPLRTIAIVDDAPEGQYLYPEFVLARQLLRRRGYDARIVDAGALRYERGALRDDDGPIDLVYNRLVDFALDDAAHAALRAAYLDGAVAVTPTPRNHALHADKRNLAALSDDALLRRWGVPAQHRQRLGASLQTELVGIDNAEALWARRRELFFKPAAGYGGKAVYRGDKLTRGAWQTVIAGNYVAQAYAPPSQRTVLVDGAPQRLKLDVRLFTYAGALLLPAARLYNGQTTNFRTPGGGFAPVTVI